MIEITKIDGFQVSMEGDYYETLVYLDAKDSRIFDLLNERVEADDITLLENRDARMIEIKAQRFLEDNLHCRTLSVGYQAA